MKLPHAGLALLFVAMLAGCAAPAQKPVSLSKDYAANHSGGKGGRIGVVMSELPRPDTQFPGAGCLLCMAVANGNHASLSKEVQRFSTDELKPLVSDLTVALQKKGLDAVAISEPLRVGDLPDIKASDANKARKDFSALKAKYGVDKLLVVHITALGVWRSYSAYIPTAPPRAVLYGNASLVDLSTHALDWYLPLEVSRAAEGEWDEPPKFPGLTSAYYQVLEASMDLIKEPFVR